MHERIHGLDPTDLPIIKETFYMGHNADTQALKQMNELVADLVDATPATIKIIQDSIEQISEKIAQSDAHAANLLGVSVEEFIAAAEASQ